MKLLAVSKLRSVNAAYLKAMEETEFIVLTNKGNHEISHVLMPYQAFLKMQDIYRQAEARELGGRE